MNHVKLRIVFENSSHKPHYIQVDPWAGFYMLRVGEKLELEAIFSTNCPTIDIDEDDETRILSLWNCHEYFVILDNKPVHWTKYQSNCLSP